MIPKQDRQGVRQAKEIEQKYHLDLDYNEIEKLVSIAQRSAESANKSVNTLAVDVYKNKQDIAKITPLESADYPGCYYRMVGESEEWINPPMAFGVEYRTEDRHNGKPVYAMAINAGAFPSSGLTTVNAPYSDAETIVSASCYAKNETDVFSVPNYQGSAAFDVSLFAIHLNTESDFSSYTAYVTVRYTKTTD